MQYLTPTLANGCINAKTNEYRRTIVDLCDNPPTARIPSTQTAPPPLTTAARTSPRNTPLSRVQRRQ
jgi:hypothetical protein